MQIQKKCHFWSRITFKSDQKWLISDMTLKSLLDYRNDKNRSNLKTKIKKYTMKLKNQNSKLSDEQLFFLATNHKSIRNFKRFIP